MSGRIDKDSGRARQVLRCIYLEPLPHRAAVETKGWARGGPTRHMGVYLQYLL